MSPLGSVSLFNQSATPVLDVEAFESIQVGLLEVGNLGRNIQFRP